MTREPFSPDQFYAELDGLGLSEVDKLAATGRWGKVGPKFELVQAWRRAKSGAEQAAIDFRAAEAAERAAIAAERAASAAERSADTADRALATAKAANTRATVAVAITAASIIATVVIAYLRPA